MEDEIFLEKPKLQNEIQEKSLPTIDQIIILCLW